MYQISDCQIVETIWELHTLKELCFIAFKLAKPVSRHYFMGIPKKCKKQLIHHTLWSSYGRGTLITSFQVASHS